VLKSIKLVCSHYLFAMNPGISRLSILRIAARAAFGFAVMAITASAAHARPRPPSSPPPSPPPPPSGGVIIRPIASPTQAGTNTGFATFNSSETQNSFPSPPD
jgi:hypothetical protein